MIDLSTINETSLTNVVFNTIDNPIDVAELQFLNVVFYSDGIYLVQKNDFCVTEDMLPYKYSNSALVENGYLYCVDVLIKKPPITILEQILDCFKYVCGKTSEELLINVYYHKPSEEFILDIVRSQIISKALVEYQYNEEYEMSGDYIRYLQIHSHNTMPPNFSGIDDKDEKNKLLSFYGVIGKINDSTSVYNMCSKFRVWTGITFREISVEDVFETELTNCGLTDETALLLDDIIAQSKIANKGKNEVLVDDKTLSQVFGEEI